MQLLQEHYVGILVTVGTLFALLIVITVILSILNKVLPNLKLESWRFVGPFVKMYRAYKKRKYLLRRKTEFDMARDAAVDKFKADKLQEAIVAKAEKRLEKQADNKRKKESMKEEFERLFGFPPEELFRRSPKQASRIDAVMRNLTARADYLIKIEMMDPSAKKKALSDPLDYEYIRMMRLLEALVPDVKSVCYWSRVHELAEGQKILTIGQPAKVLQIEDKPLKPVS